MAHRFTYSLHVDSITGDIAACRTAGPVEVSCIPAPSYNYRLFHTFHSHVPMTSRPQAGELSRVGLVFPIPRVHYNLYHKDTVAPVLHPNVLSASTINGAIDHYIY